MIPTGVRGAGLGLRRELIPSLQAGVPPEVEFFEIAPENWMDMGGASGRRFRELAQQRPIVAHGLSLSLGGPKPLDEIFLRRVRRFLEEFRIELYTEHLAYTTDDGQLYDLLNTHSIPDRSSWPRSPKGLSDQLRRIAPAYRAKGIDITHLGHSREGARWRIAQIRSQPNPATPPGIEGGTRYGAHRE